jgi:hypothetical protein
MSNTEVWDLRVYINQLALPHLETSILGLQAALQNNPLVRASTDEAAYHLGLPLTADITRTPVLTTKLNMKKTKSKEMLGIDVDMEFHGYEKARSLMDVFTNWSVAISRGVEATWPIALVDNRDKSAVLVSQHVQTYGQRMVSKFLEEGIPITEIPRLPKKQIDEFYSKGVKVISDAHDKGVIVNASGEVLPSDAIIYTYDANDEVIALISKLSIDSLVYSGLDILRLKIGKFSRQERKVLYQFEMAAAHEFGSFVGNFVDEVQLAQRARERILRSGIRQYLERRKFDPTSILSKSQFGEVVSSSYTKTLGALGYAVHRMPKIEPQA